MKIIVHRGRSTRMIDAQPLDPETMRTLHQLYAAAAEATGAHLDLLLKKIKELEGGTKDHRDCDCSDCRDRRSHDDDPPLVQRGTPERGVRITPPTDPKERKEWEAGIKRRLELGLGTYVGDRKIIIHRGHDAITWGFPKWMDYVEAHLMRIYGIDPSDTNFDYRAAHARGDAVMTVVDLVGMRYTRE